MSWNLVVFVGLVASAASALLLRGARKASTSSLRKRLRSALWILSGYSALLVAGIGIPLLRFWLLGERADPSERALQLAAAIGGVLNLILGFAAFGTLPSVAAVMLSSKLNARESRQASGAEEPA